MSPSFNRDSRPGGEGVVCRSLTLVNGRSLAGKSANMEEEEEKEEEEEEDRLRRAAVGISTRPSRVGEEDLGERIAFVDSRTLALSRPSTSLSVASPSDEDDAGEAGAAAAPSAGDVGASSKGEAGASIAGDEGVSSTMEGDLMVTSSAFRDE